MSQPTQTPSPSKEGISDDGWYSRVWTSPKGGLRLRSRGSERELNQYVKAGGALKSILHVKGSEQLCLILAQGWWEKNLGAGSGLGGKA